jgi:hypothetical protein
MSNGNLSILTLTVTAAAALSSCRFVTRAGAYPAAGAGALGVTRSSAGQAGELVPADVLGTAIVELAGTVAADQAIATDASGHGVAATGEAAPIAVAQEAGVAGSFIEVLLLPIAAAFVAA